jgi:hypothetical protein
LKPGPSKVRAKRGVLVGALVLCAAVVSSSFVDVAHAQRARRGSRTETTQAPAAEAAPASGDAPATTPTSAREPSAADRQAAGQAYDRATAAYLSRNYGQAATLFETAYRLAPSSAALLQAVRSHERAGNQVRAATLALRLQAFYGSEDAARRQAEQTIGATSGQLLRIDVTCRGACTLELDGVIQEHTSFFATPASAHTVRASFETGPVEREVSGAAGTTSSLTFDAPAAQVAEVATEQGTTSSTETSTSGTTTPVDTGGGGLSPAFFVAGLVGTAVVGGVLVWSGVDTLGGVSAYEAMPTVEGLRDGQSRELRTNVLIGVTGALALTTLVFAILTDWDGTPASAEPSVQASAILGPDVAALQLAGRF